MGGKGSGRSADPNSPDNKLLRKLGDALAKDKAEKKAQNSGARAIRKLQQKRGQK